MILGAYQKAVQQQQLNKDAAQAVAVSELQRLYDELVQSHEQYRSPLKNIIARLFGTRRTPQGIYLWGGVGRGKTLLMNMFFQALPFQQKRRLHFHHFMLDVHEKLTAMQHSDAKYKNPLQQLARLYARELRIICLDEFIVTNITDAMLLYGLLDALFKEGVVLVATSNRAPDELYLNGLQRERFLPAIALIKQHTQIVHINSNTDHRLTLLEQSHVYHTPLSADTQQRMQTQFDALCAGSTVSKQTLIIHNREIATIAVCDEVVWFDFDVLCNAPRATPDYIAIAKQYRIVLLSGVPVMNEENDDKARRFIYLVDELYDKNITLIMSAATSVDELYSGEMLAFAFKRVRSRLIEMRSDAYLSQAQQ